MANAVAGILDKNGGLRVVATQLDGFKEHVGEGEKLYIVPGMLVPEPVPWEEIPDVILTVQKHISKEVAPVNHCGECMACCYTLFIKDGIYQKPSHRWCQNCIQGHGCKVYFQRPEPCKNFECLWLKSQKRNDRMVPELRPDKCGAIFTEDTSADSDPLLIECHGTPNKDAWDWINEMQSVGYKVKEITFYHGEGD